MTALARFPARREPRASAGADQASAWSLDQRRRLEAAIEAAIDLLDRLDAPAEDLEDEGDWEPWLASPENCGHQLCWARGTDDDRELTP